MVEKKNYNSKAFAYLHFFLEMQLCTAVAQSHTENNNSHDSKC